MKNILYLITGMIIAVAIYQLGVRQGFQAGYNSISVEANQD